MAIIYETENRALFKKSSDESLLDLCLTEKLTISHACEGMASCGTCRVIITDGLENLPARNPLEQEMADDRGFAANERLACQTPIKTSFQFRLPEDQ